jgi:hypothetical protein
MTSGRQRQAMHIVFRMSGGKTGRAVGKVIAVDPHIEPGDSEQTHLDLAGLGDVKLAAKRRIGVLGLRLWVRRMHPKGGQGGLRQRWPGQPQQERQQWPKREVDAQFDACGTKRLGWADLQDRRMGVQQAPAGSLVGLAMMAIGRVAQIQR